MATGLTFLEKFDGAIAHLFIPAVLALLLWPIAGAGADSAALELQRMQLQRAQQQNELQLRMQQYHQSVLAPPSSLGERLRRNELDLSQRWRQQQLHQQQLQRETALRATPGADEPASQRRIDIMRAEQESEAQLQRFGWERETAAAPGSGAFTGPADPAAAR